MRRLALVLWSLAALKAQSISVTSPSAGQTLSGFQGFAFTVALSGAPPTTRVCYTVDAYPAFAVGQSSGCALSSPFSFPWNTHMVLNGPHQVVATAYNALGGVVATSAAVAFTTANTWPISNNPTLTVSPGTPETSNWTGIVNVSATAATTGSSRQFNFWVDGILIENKGSATTTAAADYDTRQFSNGPHIVAITVLDPDHQTSYPGFPSARQAAEWSHVVTFANGTTAMSFKANASEVYLAPAGTFALTGSILNTDGSTSATTPKFLSLNPAACTVGQTTGVVTGVANGNCTIFAMAPTASATDLLVRTPNYTVTSASLPFTLSNLGQAIQITSGSGFTPGVYYIVHITPSGNFADLDHSPGATGSGGGNFSIGPTSKITALVASSNILPHFGSDGSVLTAYDPSKSMFLHAIFAAAGEIDPTLPSGGNEQPYSPGFLPDVQASGFNALGAGLGVTSLVGQTSGSSATFHTAQTNYVNGFVSLLAPYPRIKLYLQGDDYMRADDLLWAATSGPAASWATPGFQDIIQSWAGTNLAMGVAMQDEVNSSWSGQPLQGPIIFDGANSGLTSIVASSGTCTVNWTNYTFNATRRFLIHGSVTANMNSTAGNLYTASGVNANQFTFACAGVANGTYNSGNDPALMIEPYAASWQNSNTDYVHYDAFAKLRGWFQAVTGHMSETNANAAGTTAASIANWGGNGLAGSVCIGSICQIGDHVDIFNDPSATDYLGTVGDTMPLMNLIYDRVHGYYGGAGTGYSPQKPITILTAGTVTDYGLQGPNVALTSCADALCTFSAPHGITNIVPGITRLTISGSSNSAYNTDYYVIDAPSPTTLNLMGAKTSFTGTSNAATITYQNGDTQSVSSLDATGSNASHGTGQGGFVNGDTIGASPTTVFNRHRNQTFTVSGASVSGFNTNKFFMLVENPVQSINTGFYRQLPSGSTTGGTANIVADNLYVRGRNGGLSYTNTPDKAAATTWLSAILRGSGERIYDYLINVQGYLASEGLYGATNTTLFNDPTIPVQLFMNAHYENDHAVPLFHAMSQAAKLINRLQKFLLQPTLNAPDTGIYGVVCTARTGSYGKLLICLNLRDAPATVQFDLSPYLQSGQQIIRYTTTWNSIVTDTLTAGTSSDSRTLEKNGVAVYVFPVTFAGELPQPLISARLADVPNAAKIAVRYGYDPYFLDLPATGTVFDCGTGLCVLPVDRNLGTVYYRLVYLNNSTRVLATSSVQTLE